MHATPAKCASDGHPIPTPGLRRGSEAELSEPRRNTMTQRRRSGAGPDEFSPAEAPALRIVLLAPQQLRLASPARTHARNETISRLRGLASADALPLNLRF